MYTVLESISTANPPFKFSQMDFAKFMSQVEKLPVSLRKRMFQIHNISGIDYRYSCIKDYGQEPENFEFYPKNWSLSPFPTTAQRNRQYKTSVVSISVEAAQLALWKADISTEEITHLIIVSCTGFFAPGLDIHLVKELGLKQTISRTVIGFMGCHAALNGLKIAHSICQSNYQARVLVVCAELCTLHFQFGNTLQNAISNAIFSDGVGVAILASRTFEQAKNKFAYINDSCMLNKNSIEHLEWDINDTGFSIKLSREVPQIIASCLPAYLENFLNYNSLSLKKVDFWAVHPGGRQIIEKAQVALSLSDEQLKDSYNILRLYGNMSSATIMFVLKEILNRHEHNIKHRKESCKTLMALTFGPGLSIESCLFRTV